MGQSKYSRIRQHATPLAVEDHRINQYKWSINETNQNN